MIVITFVSAYNIRSIMGNMCTDEQQHDKNIKGQKKKKGLQSEYSKMGETQASTRTPRSRRLNSF